jgi:hypothetical protein
VKLLKGKRLAPVLRAPVEQPRHRLCIRCGESVAVCDFAQPWREGDVSDTFYSPPMGASRQTAHVRNPCAAHAIRDAVDSTLTARAPRVLHGAQHVDGTDEMVPNDPS